MIKKILISQPKPQNNRNPYQPLVEKFGVEIDFKKLFNIEPLTAKEFKKQKIDLNEITAIILTSKIAVDHLFNIFKQLNYTVPADMKYFCKNQTIANYLSKYITIRKRKLFEADGSDESLLSLISKHKEEVYLFPTSEGHKPSLYNKIKKNKIAEVKLAEIYRNVPVDLSDLDIYSYDLIVLFSPYGAKFLLEQYPDLVNKKDIYFATSGKETFNTLKKLGITPAIKFTNKEFTSMTQAIEQFLEKQKQKVEAN